MPEGQEPQVQDQIPPAQPPAPTPPAPPAPPAAPPAPPAPQAPQAGENDLPQWALDQRKALRDEAAANRVALREERTKWEGGLTKSEVDALRNEHAKFVRETIGRQVGLDEKLFERIQGTTPEEMRADALTLAGGVPRTPQASGAGLTPGVKPGAAISASDRAKASFRSPKHFIR